MIVYTSPEGHVIRLAEPSKKPNRLYITKQQLMALIGVSMSTVDKWLRLGTVPYYKLGPDENSRIVFDVQEIQEWMKQFRVPARHEGR